MKELSIKEKAKAYDKALEKAKDNYNAADSADINVNSFKNTLIDLFPELKESEDERIRKVLLNDFKNNCSEYYCEGVNRDMIIAWLEKQGEQKPTTIQIGRNYKCIVPPRYTCFKTGFVYKPCDEFLCGLMNFCSDCFEPIEGEQKAADKVEPKFHEGEWITIKE